MKVAVAAYNRLLAAHVRAYNALHDLFESGRWPPPRVTMNTFCSDVYWSEKMLLDLLCLRERGVRPELKGYLQAGSIGLHHALLKADLPFQPTPLCGWDVCFTSWSTRSRPSTLSRTHLATSWRLLRTRSATASSTTLAWTTTIHSPAISFGRPSFGDTEFRRESLRSHLMDSLLAQMVGLACPPGRAALLLQILRLGISTRNPYRRKWYGVAEKVRQQHCASATRPPDAERVSEGPHSGDTPPSGRAGADARAIYIGQLPTTTNGDLTRRGLDFSASISQTTPRRLAVDHLGDRPSRLRAADCAVPQTVGFNRPK